MKVTEVAQPGKPRQIQAFELRMNIIADATIDLLFTKNRVTLALALVLMCFLLSLFFSLFLANLCDLSSSVCCSSCLCLFVTLFACVCVFVCAVITCGMFSYAATE